MDEESFIVRIRHAPFNEGTDQDVKVAEELFKDFVTNNPVQSELIYDFKGLLDKSDLNEIQLLVGALVQKLSKEIKNDNFPSGTIKTFMLDYHEKMVELTGKIDY